MPEMGSADIVQACNAMLGALRRRDLEACEKAANSVFEDGPRATFGALVGLASTLVATRPDAVAFAIPVMLDPKTGEMVDIGSEGPAAAFAMQFIAAVCNEDKDTAVALWAALQDAGVNAVADGFLEVLMTIAGFYSPDDEEIE